ncbi:hypothetical protein H8N01_14190 [Streptomyces sp. AC536]|uniref:hypothetical protein n=1 Tax=Streptomyces buecherae TaxID=2763006 RepID=UPI00164DB4BB|nr:hypothetical protein [Streptomyces buecherae]MBC3983678.1 hypothetical protein [Streptomyces buecherae]QNJ39569.1 hypothetical protein H7H31_06460 [Streptomyces buecherae]
MIGAVLGSLLLCGWAAGCGSPSSLADVQRRVEAEPSAKPTARPSPTAGADRAAKTEPTREATRRTTDINAIRMRVTTWDRESGHLYSEIAMTEKPRAMSRRMYMPAPGGKPVIELRVVGSTLYLRDPEAEASGDKPWTRVTDALPQKRERGTDREQPADDLAGVEDDTTLFPDRLDEGRRIGTETIDGVRTTHYRLYSEVSTAELRAKAKDETLSWSRRLTLLTTAKRYEAQGITRFTMDGWVNDATQTTKRFRMRGETADGPVESTVTFLDVAETFRIGPPPADQVEDGTDWDWSDLADEFREFGVTLP